MEFNFILSTAILFFLLMDPFGNLPLFIAAMRKFPGERYLPVVLRESLLALGAMMVILLSGKWLLRLLDLSVGELHLAGGVILLVMGVRMVFSKFTGEDAFEMEDEPRFVPLAIPLICGPGVMAMLITIRGSSLSATLPNLLLALFLAWSGGTVILLCGRPISKLLGLKALDAFESLMGLLLTTIAVGMLVSGIHELYGIGPA